MRFWILKIPRILRIPKERSENESEKETSPKKVLGQKEPSREQKSRTHTKWTRAKKNTRGTWHVASYEQQLRKEKRVSREKRVGEMRDRNFEKSWNL